MPRGQKSKLRAREKRCQARGKNQDVAGAVPDTATEGEELVASASDLPGCEYEKVSSAHGGESAMSPRVSEEGTRSEDEKSSDSSPSSEVCVKDPLNSKVVSLVQFLMEKYKNREMITKADMMKCVIKTYKNHFSEILKRASEHMELAYGVDMKEVDPIRHCYALVNKLEQNLDSGLGDERMPNTGLLMIVLGIILTKKKCAPEEDIWEVLNMMGVYANRNHFIYGNPKKIITQDLVELKYLERHQVPDSNPPRYQFMWGTKALAEISKMKILEFWAKIHDVTPSAFPSLYEEALKDEEEKAQARAAARVRTPAIAASHSTVMPKSPSHMK